MGIVGCGSSSVDVDVDILELSRLDFSKDDIRILLSSFEEMLHHSPSKDIANLQGASVYFGIEISPFIRRLFDIESDRAPMPPKRFIHSIWSICTLRPENLSYIVFDLYSFKARGGLLLSEVGLVFADMHGSALSKYPLKDMVMSRIQQLQCMHPVDAALSREEFHRFVFSNKEYITGVITELQSLLQVKTLGKQRWKALQSTRISLSGGLHLSHEEYINNAKSKFKEFSGRYAHFRKERLKDRAGKPHSPEPVKAVFSLMRQRSAEAVKGSRSKLFAQGSAEGLGKLQQQHSGMTKLAGRKLQEFSPDMVHPPRYCKPVIAESKSKDS